MKIIYISFLECDSQFFDYNKIINVGGSITSVYGLGIFNNIVILCKCSSTIVSERNCRININKNIFIFSVR